MIHMTTILVDKDLCTRCGICSEVCTMGIVTPADENTLPGVKDTVAGMCIQCGHCEVSCPSQALLLNIRPDEKVSLPAGAGTIPPDDIAFYMKKRRSVRHFTNDPVPKEKIVEVLDIARYAASGGNGQPVQWIVVHDPCKGERDRRTDHRMDENPAEYKPPDERLHTDADWCLEHRT